VCTPRLELPKWTPTAPSLIPTVNGNTVRSFPTHRQQPAAQGSSTNVSRSDIRLIQHFDSSAHGLVRRWLLLQKGLGELWMLIAVCPALQKAFQHLCGSRSTLTALLLWVWGTACVADQRWGRRAAHGGATRAPAVRPLAAATPCHRPKPAQPTSAGIGSKKPHLCVERGTRGLEGLARCRGKESKRRDLSSRNHSGINTNHHFYDRRNPSWAHGK
jgi:hypothetical protein